MKYKTMHEWCQDMGRHIVYEMTTPDELFRAEMYGGYLLTLLDWLDTKNESFKKQLVDIINRYAINNFANPQQKHFFLIYNTVHYNQVMGSFYKQGIPYREDKWLNKAQTKNEKNIKNKIIEFCPASPKEHLVKFKSLSEEILNNFDFDHNHQITTTNKIRERNCLIDALIDVIVSDNYINSNKGERKSFYSDMRTSDKSKNFIQAENEIEKLSIKNKRCYEPIRENATLKECIEFMNSENYGKAKRYYRIIPSKKMGQ
ncbi:MAG: hypothetical protein KBE02_06725 [Sulfurospirillum sp.]|nr:hypothetical protein [Sulfurospirillum sp.]